MRTLVISDLHIGASTQTDVLRRPGPRAALAEAALEGVDRLVVLGDGLELRDGPHRDAVEVAGPFFEDVGERCRSASCCCPPATTTTGWWPAGSTAGC